LLSKDISEVEKLTRQESVFILTSGSNKAALDVAGSMILVLSDFISLVLVVITLLILDPITAIVTFVLFGSIGLILFNHLKNRASRLGESNSRHFVDINNSILMTLDNLRFIKPANLMESRIADFNKLRSQQSQDLAELSVMPYVSKYVFEVALVLGALLISALQFVLHDAIHAITTLTVFLAAGGRLAPAALRLQQSLLLIRANISYTEPVLKLYRESSAKTNGLDIDNPVSSFISQVELHDVCYQYPDSNSLALKNINLNIPDRSFTAIVGPSGAGKSTLIDVLLGLNSPQSGDVKISGQKPLVAYKSWPGKVSYVPQRTTLIDGTIAENISFGRLATSESQIMEAIKLSNLEEVIDSLSEGIHTPIGELGSRLSAGQQQRIGIARALFSKPELLIMDEATSALDSQTERDLSESLAKLRSQVTLLIVAHRLTTIVDADKVVYMAKGEILAEGSMVEVRNSVPNFNEQAQILGIGL
jgi:ABC-type multidrug transport system fused ATPase/permease subunit